MAHYLLRAPRLEGPKFEVKVWVRPPPDQEQTMAVGELCIEGGDDAFVQVILRRLRLGYGLAGRCLGPRMRWSDLHCVMTSKVFAELRPQWVEVTA